MAFLGFVSLVPDIPVLILGESIDHEEEVSCLNVITGQCI